MNIIRIMDLSDERLNLYTKYNECQLLHYYEPHGGLFICETPMVIERAFALGCEALSFLVEESAFETELVQALIKNASDDIDVFLAPLETINKMTGFNLTRGVVSVMKRPNDIDARDIIYGKRRIAILEDVLNPTNVGAIFRSAAALGVEAILLTRASSDPFYRRAARVSMGTVFQIPWAYLDKSADINEFMHESGFKTCAMALREDAISVSSECLKEEERLAIILGTEAFGIQDNTINGADYKVIIPMSASVDSLNVAAASAVAFWELAGSK